MIVPENSEDPGRIFLELLKSVQCDKDVIYIAEDMSGGNEFMEYVIHV